MRYRINCLAEVFVLGLIAVLISIASAYASDWPQRGPNRDGVWSETGIIEKFDTPEVKIRWRVPVFSDV